ncbi:hypothetical protein BAUCODRAFT_35875 [Baudoinia panamericana UAMH 10762]|uniref:Uncharacterized protein n=1 Tax=Baudoinia panamericana (strain UAMH 10762) TaxID=717646 RepID=M2MDL7_BAUPA|nr:uncharacterized protein BAUCODRAFT_35875 [Baudoinia panamericana UAMH 10762]EMC94641.1 hypothetical protein BAUCODRAFT_35875 [Baudoinia panamericana UAMH 10762]
MTNPKSASNAWAAIKKKIMFRAGLSKDGGKDGSASPSKEDTPVATPKKRGKSPHFHHGVRNY